MEETIGSNAVTTNNNDHNSRRGEMAFKLKIMKRGMKIISSMIPMISDPVLKSQKKHLAVIMAGRGFYDAMFAQ